jgi:sulfonate transport system substrate-binding protein
MHRRAVLAMLVAAGLTARPALAQTTDIRMMRPLDLLALPLLVMERQHLIERTAESMGLGQLHVTWSAPGKDGAITALAAGEADFAMVDLVPFLVAADSGADQPGALRALGAVAERPFVLVTRNPRIHTILDFTARDRIAVPDAKLSQPTLMLEMAAALEWGPKEYARLDPLLVAMSDAAADAALVSGKGDIDAHFSHSPYTDDELGQPGIHRVMDSFDVAGPHSNAVLAATADFGAANPDLCKAILAALQAADDLIAQRRGTAAEIFAGMAKDRGISVEELSDMIGDPDLHYAAAPAGIMRLTQFMQRIGRLKNAPLSWQDFFLATSRDLKGS